MQKNKMKIEKSLYIIFWILIGTFILLISCFAIPDFMINKHSVFPLIAILAAAFFLSGILLIILAIKAKTKIRRASKRFLILTGASAAGFLISIVLHNFYYALAMITGSYLMKIYHAAFFLVGIPICPICFLIGVVGSIIFMIKKKIKKKKKKIRR